MNISEFKNKHEGERAFIIGNGPSLKSTPLECLNNEYTLATNKINKIFDHTEWRPTYFSYTQHQTWAENHGTYKEITQTIDEDITCFISPEHSQEFGKKENVYYYNKLKMKGPSAYKCLNRPEPPEADYDYWSDDINKCVYHYCSSIYPLYQVANYMGFKEIYLLGCDLGIDTTDHIIFKDARDPYIFSKNSNQNSSTLEYYWDFLYRSRNPVKSLVNGIYFKSKELVPFCSLGHQFHFVDEYQTSEKIKVGTDDKQKRAHNLAKRKLHERNIEIYNATIGGELEIFPRVELSKSI